MDNRLPFLSLVLLSKHHNRAPSCFKPRQNKLVETGECVTVTFSRFEIQMMITLVRRYLSHLITDTAGFQMRVAPQGTSSKPPHHEASLSVLGILPAVLAVGEL